MSTRLSCSFALPTAFRPEDILAFHRRDLAEVAERVSATALHKGLRWNDAPACLSIRFESGRADAELAIDGVASADDEARLATMVRRILGLDQRVEAFEEGLFDHPEVGALIASQRGLRVPLATTPYEALSWAIIGQQISLGAAVSIRRRLILATAARHSDGLLCYPQAGEIAEFDPEALRRLGFSASKAATLLTVSRLVADHALPLDAWLHTLPVDEIQQRLLAVRGIGPWTVSYTLLRGFGWLDGSLHGDVAVRRAMQALFGSDEKIGEERAKSWLAEFSPWRALLAAHLWRLLAAKASANFSAAP